MSPDLPERLAARLARPLPGALAQWPLQPELSFGRHFAPPPADARPAAVLALLYPCGDQWRLPLTLRPANLVDHAGQISFPGGLVEPGETSQQAALRELQEELGVGPEGVELLGQLSRIYLFNSNFAIVPHVAVLRTRPRWSPNPAEVAQLIEFPLAGLDRASVDVIEHRRAGIAFRSPCFRYEEHAIWGATCLMLGELAAVLAELPAG